MIHTRGEIEARRSATGGTPLSFRSLPSPVLAAVGLTPGVGVPPAGEPIGVGEVFTVGVTVGDVAAVGVTVGVAWVGEAVGVTGAGVGVTVTGGRPTGVLCGPDEVGVPFWVPPGPGVEPGVGDELATVPLELELATSRTGSVASGLPEASEALMICAPGDQPEPVPSQSVAVNDPAVLTRAQADWWPCSSKKVLPSK